LRRLQHYVLDIDRVLHTSSWAKSCTISDVCAGHKNVSIGAR
jgi:hypothetical protein